MKKLLLSLIAFASIFAFTSCEKTPADPFQEELATWEGVPANSYVYTATRQQDKIGTKFTIQLMSNELSYENRIWKGDGDFVTLTFYATILSDGFPENKRYDFVPYDQVSADQNQCLVGGDIQTGAPLGTFAYDVDEATQTAAGLLCTDGYILCSGNTDNAKIIAVLTFLTPNQETVQREYIVSEKMEIIAK